MFSSVLQAQKWSKAFLEVLYLIMFCYDIFFVPNRSFEYILWLLILCFCGIPLSVNLYFSVTVCVLLFWHFFSACLVFTFYFDFLGVFLVVLSYFIIIFIYLFPKECQLRVWIWIEVKTNLFSIKRKWGKM